MQENYVNCLNPTYNTVVCGFILQVEETAINERNIRPISDTNQRCGQQSRGLEPGSFSTLWLKMMYVFFRLASVSSHYLFLSHVPRIGGFYLKVFVRNRSILIPVTKSALRKHHYVFIFLSTCRAAKGGITKSQAALRVEGVILNKEQRTLWIKPNIL